MPAATSPMIVVISGAYWMTCGRGAGRRQPADELVVVARRLGAGKRTSGSAASRLSGIRRSCASSWSPGIAAIVCSRITSWRCRSMSDWIGGRTSATSTTPVLSARSCSAVERSRSSISTPGRLRRKRCTAAGTIDSSAEPTNETRSSPACPAPMRAGGGHGGVELGQHGAGVAQERLAGGGELDAAAGALEQPDPQLGLEGADLLAERRLGDVQTSRRAPEVQLLGDGDEIAKLAEFHDLDLRLIREPNQ